MENREVELYLVSGFLGAGKTTFLKRVLTDLGNDRVGVIVNEFGSVGIDKADLGNDEIPIVEINRGSVFCACLKGGFVKTLAAFLTQPIDRLYVEASGMADPSGMEDMLPELEPLIEKRYKTDRRYRYKGCVCVVDAKRFNALSNKVPATISQVKKSNLVVINKTDRVDTNGLETVRAQILEINPEAVIFDTTYCEVPLDVVSKALDGERIVKYGDSLNTEENRPYGGVLEVPGEYSREDMRAFVTDISEDIYRIKGFFKAKEGYRFLSSVDGEIEIRACEDKEREELKLVLIGVNHVEEKSTLENKIRGIWEKYFEGECVIYED